MQLVNKKINGLLKKKAFEVNSFSNIFSKIRIFHFCFIDKIKNKRTAIIFVKSKLMIQAYNNYSKEKILTPSTIIK